MKVYLKYSGVIFGYFIIIFMMAGCMKKVEASGPSAMEYGGEIEKMSETDRMIIWRASLSLEVNNVSDSINDVSSVIEKIGGFVENKNINGEKSANLQLRVPSNNLTSIVDELAKLGNEKNRNIFSEDVTEQYIDTDARLKNALALRDTLRELLEKAKEVKDILEIERELTRVQSDIDSMEGRLKKLKGQIDFASINLHLEQKTILGPLGFASKGIGWFIKKLFILR